MHIDDLIGKLQQLKPIPHSLLVQVEGDEPSKVVAVPNVRNRWRRIASVLEQIRWVAVEARDKSGATLAVLRDDREDAAPSTIGTDAGGVTLREAQLIELVTASNDRACARVLEAGEKASQRYERMFASLIAGVRSQLETIAVGQRLATAQYHQALGIQQQLLVDARDRREDDDDPEANPLGPLLEVVGKLSAPNRPNGKGADRTAAPKVQPSTK